MKETNKAQKVSFFFAIACYVCALLCLIGVVYYGQQLGSDDPIVAALASSIVFFTGAGVVLHVIGRANLPDLKVR